MTATVAVAVKARIEASIDGITVYDGDVPDEPVGPRYVVLYCDSGTRTSETICGTSDELAIRMMIHSVAFGVGLDLSGMCRWLSAAVRDALTDWALASDDIIRPAPVRHDQSLTPRRDKTVASRPTVYAVDTFHVDGTFA